MAENTRLFRLMALISYFGLLSWVILWHFFLTAESAYSTLFLFLFWVLPLLFPGYGIVKGKPYTHAWANFIVMIYLMHGLTAIYTNQSEWFYALVEIILASTLFIGCSYYARFRGRELGLGLKKLSEENQ